MPLTSTEAQEFVERLRRFQAADRALASDIYPALLTPRQERARQATISEYLEARARFQAAAAAAEEELGIGEAPKP